MKKLILIFAVLTVLVSSCKKELTQPVENKTMSDLIVNEDFDWKTSMDVDVLLTSSARNVILINSLDGSNYHKGLMQPNVEYITKITVPTYVTEVELVYDDVVYKLALENNKVEYSFN